MTVGGPPWDTCGDDGVGDGGDDGGGGDGVITLVSARWSAVVSARRLAAVLARRLLPWDAGDGDGDGDGGGGGDGGGDGAITLEYLRRAHPWPLKRLRLVGFVLERGSVLTSEVPVCEWERVRVSEDVVYILTTWTNRTRKWTRSEHV